MLQKKIKIKTLKLPGWVEKGGLRFLFFFIFFSSKFKVFWLHLNQILLFWVLYARLWPQEQDYFFLAADYKPLKFMERSIKCTLQYPAFSLNTSLWFSLIRSPIVFSNLRCYYAVSVFLPNFLHVSSLSQLSSSAKTQENPYHSKRNEFISTLKRFLPSPDSFFFLLQSLRLKLWYSQKFVQKMLTCHSQLCGSSYPPLLIFTLPCFTLTHQYWCLLTVKLLLIFLLIKNLYSW